MGKEEITSVQYHQAAERQSYKELVIYIRNELLSNPQVLPMIDIES